MHRPYIFIRITLLVISSSNLKEKLETRRIILPLTYVSG